MRSNKAEEEVAELMKKSTQLEVELDKTKEELVMMLLILKMVMNSNPGDDHPKAGRQGEGLAGGRDGSAHAEQEKCSRTHTSLIKSNFSNSIQILRNSAPLFEIQHFRFTLNI